MLHWLRTMDAEPLAVPARHLELPRSSRPSVEGWFLDFLREAERSGREGAPTLRAWVELAEAWRILQALREAGGNRSAAARTLGIGRRTLYAKMERLGIEPAWSRRGLAHIPPEGP